MFVSVGCRECQCPLRCGDAAAAAPSGLSGDTSHSATACRPPKDPAAAASKLRLPLAETSGCCWCFPPGCATSGRGASRDIRILPRASGGTRKGRFDDVTDSLADKCGAGSSGAASTSASRGLPFAPRAPGCCLLGRYADFARLCFDSGGSIFVCGGSSELARGDTRSRKFARRGTGRVGLLVRRKNARELDRGVQGRPGR
eukprot:Gregarina_sp_Pseudo_9__755@NODE_1484_length_1556_cov_9_754779_g1374_i0_p2_GENE_NODE_1484_length_1556_cov_9_754779_g1374_i0NODE_1484_length_1556_cov_9_754779_g1374_i0_p2_ORF_typecomplete_len201_score11_84_NODE_1484_length_1556_cov_9_754779_g1374_i05121114